MMFCRFLTTVVCAGILLGSLTQAQKCPPIANLQLFEETSIFVGGSGQCVTMDFDKCVAAFRFDYTRRSLSFRLALGDTTAQCCQYSSSYPAMSAENNHCTYVKLPGGEVSLRTQNMNDIKSFAGVAFDVVNVDANDIFVRDFAPMMGTYMASRATVTVYVTTNGDSFSGHVGSFEGWTNVANVTLIGPLSAGSVPDLDLNLELRVPGGASQGVFLAFEGDFQFRTFHGRYSDDVLAKDPRVMIVGGVASTNIWNILTPNIQFAGLVKYSAGEPLDECIPQNPAFIGDGFCHDENYNKLSCGWDGGDCCDETCVPGVGGFCQDGTFDCRDPSVIGCGNCWMSFPPRSGGCDVPDVEACVCEADEFCCDESGFWDRACVGIAHLPPCDAACPGACEDCLEFHPTSGCENKSTEKCVCDLQPFCCANYWDRECVDLAQTVCLETCSVVPLF